MPHRRQFLQNAFLAMGGISLPGALPNLAAAGAGPSAAPTRFIFMHKGNGLYPNAMVPPSFGKQEMESEILFSYRLTFLMLGTC